MRFNKEFFKKDFMNKFLSFSFKFGKVFAVITLIVLLVTMICSGIFLLKFDCQKVKTPSFETPAEVFIVASSLFMNRNCESPAI